MSRRGARAVLAWGALAGLVMTAYLLVKGSTVGIDAAVYYHAADAWLAGGDPYAVAPLRWPGFTYLYPPWTLAAFAPFALVDSWAPLFGALVLANLAAGLGTGLLLASYVESRGVLLGRVDYALCAVFVAASVPAAPSVVFGQVNHLLVAAIAGGLVALERNRERVAGAALGAAAAVKLFPAALGAWLLRRRSWRAVAAAVATGTAAALAGLVVLGPDLHRTYLETVRERQAHVATAMEGGLAADQQYVTLQRPLSHLLPDHPDLLLPAAGLVLAVPLAVLYRRADTRFHRELAVGGTVLAVLLAFPSYPLYGVYVVYPLVPLLYLLRGPGRRLLLAGVALAQVTVTPNEGELLAPLVGADLATAVVEATRPVLAVASVPLWGLLLALAGLVWAAIAGPPGPTPGDAGRTAGDGADRFAGGRGGD